METAFKNPKAAVLVAILPLLIGACEKPPEARETSGPSSSIDQMRGDVLPPGDPNVDKALARAVARFEGVEEADLRVCDASQTASGQVVVFAHLGGSITGDGGTGGLAYLTHTGEAVWSVRQISSLPLPPRWLAVPGLSALTTLDTEAGPYVGGFIDPSAEAVELIASGAVEEFARTSRPCFALPLHADVVQLRIKRDGEVLTATSLPWSATPPELQTPDAFDVSDSEARTVLEDLLSDPAAVPFLGPGPPDACAAAFAEVVGATPRIVRLEGGAGAFTVTLGNGARSAMLLLYLGKLRGGIAVVAYEYRRGGG